MTPEEAVQHYWEEIWSTGDVDSIGDFYADPFIENDRQVSIEEFKRNVIGTREQFPDFTVEVQGLFSAADRVISRVTYHATHGGKPFNAPGLDVFHFEGGLVPEHWHVADHAEIYRQLGVKLKLPEG